VGSYGFSEKIMTEKRKQRVRLIIDISYEDRQLIKKKALEMGVTLRKFVVDALAAALISNK
jgi:hypothetical protein